MRSGRSTFDACAFRVQLDRAHLRGAEQRIDAVDRQQRPVAGIEPSCCVTNGISRRSACFWKNSSPAMSPGRARATRAGPSGPAAATARPIASSARGRSCACRLRIEHPLGMRDAHAADTIGGGPALRVAGRRGRARAMLAAVRRIGLRSMRGCAMRRAGFVHRRLRFGWPRHFADDLPRRLVFAQRDERRLPHDAVARPFREFAFGDERRLDQWTRVRDRSRGGGRTASCRARAGAASPRAGRADACRTRCRPDRHSATAVCRVAACRPRPVRTPSSNAPKPCRLPDGSV